MLTLAAGNATSKKSIKASIERKSPASCQGAAWLSDMCCNFCLVKNCKIVKNSAATKAREKNKHRIGILRIIEIFD
jgi:hypothetical protein